MHGAKLTFLRVLEEYIISPGNHPLPSPQPQTQRVSAYRTQGAPAETVSAYGASVYGASS